jgi:hypothetical protein
MEIRGSFSDGGYIICSVRIVTTILSMVLYLWDHTICGIHNFLVDE